MSKSIKSVFGVRTQLLAFFFFFLSSSGYSTVQPKLRTADQKYLY